MAWRPNRGRDQRSPPLRRCSRIGNSRHVSGRQPPRCPARTEPARHRARRTRDWHRRAPTLCCRRTTLGRGLRRARGAPAGDSFGVKTGADDPSTAVGEVRSWSPRASLVDSADFTGARVADGPFAMPEGSAWAATKQSTWAKMMVGAQVSVSFPRIDRRGQRSPRGDRARLWSDVLLQARPRGSGRPKNLLRLSVLSLKRCASNVRR